MVYIISTMLRKAIEMENFNDCKTLDEIWKSLILLPEDYSYSALNNKVTRALMAKCQFKHGGKEYDSKYPEGIPTSIKIVT